MDIYVTEISTEDKEKIMTEWLIAACLSSSGKCFIQVWNNKMLNDLTQKTNDNIVLVTKCGTICFCFYFFFISGELLVSIINYFKSQQGQYMKSSTGRKIGIDRNVVRLFIVNNSDGGHFLSLNLRSTIYKLY